MPLKFDVQRIAEITAQMEQSATSLDGIHIGREILKDNGVVDPKDEPDPRELQRDRQLLALEFQPTKRRVEEFTARLRAAADRLDSELSRVDQMLA